MLTRLKTCPTARAALATTPDLHGEKLVITAYDMTLPTRLPRDILVSTISVNIRLTEKLITLSNW